MAMLCVDRPSRQVVHCFLSRPFVNCTDGSNPGGGLFSFFSALFSITATHYCSRLKFDAASTSALFLVCPVHLHIPFHLGLFGLQCRTEE